MLQYLFGLERDAVEGRIAIAPHLPADWGVAKMEDARVGDVRFNITVKDGGRVRRVLVDPLIGSLRIDAVVSVAGNVDGVVVNGEAVQPTMESRWGRSRALLPGLRADVGRPLRIEVTKALQ
jgi:hypothetical protein